MIKNATLWRVFKIAYKVAVKNFHELLITWR